ncbi:MAG: hypothetical protein EU548_00680 [Promethearchaeota archaeon]|nr:MAG: hypothetical protein EU548_00680 [Candidatus Lokiarchaeota archaeon]
MSIKKFIDNISDIFTSSGDAISKVIKENNQYLDAILDVVKESKEGIDALKNYAIIETPSLENAINSLAETFESIEEARENMVNDLREKFINPMNEIIEEAKLKNNEIKESKSAEKTLEKAQKKYDNLKGKPVEKLKPEKLEEAESKLKMAKEHYDKEESEAKAAMELFNKKRLGIIQTILKNFADIEKSFHSKVLELMGVVRQKADEIKIEEESKLDVKILKPDE